MSDPLQPPGGGLPDLGALFEQAQEMLSAQVDVGDDVVVGQAGGGAVRVEVTGSWQFKAVTISPEAVDPDDVELLQDLVLAALHDATRRVEELHEQAMAGLDLGGLLGGVGLPGADEGRLAEDTDDEPGAP